MTALEEYQYFTETTAVYPKEEELQYLVLEMASEVGEVAGKLKKRIRGDSNYQDPDKFKEWFLDELSDVCYPLSQLCNHFGISMEELLQRNTNKLSSRKLRGTIKGDGDTR